MTHALVPGNNLAHSRFTDLCNEPMRLLSPIKGHENKPLVSLEEAVEPISYLFDSIEQYVWISKENCKNPKEGLTQDESASICLYTMEFCGGPSLYRLLNLVLRSEERKNITRWFLFLKLFLTALHKLPSHQCKVWRGIRNADLSSQYTIGKEVVWWGVSSCTSELNVLENEQFLGKHGMRTVVSIACRNGKKIASHSYYQNKEHEVILMPGSYFHVKGNLNLLSGCYMIDIEEISPPFAFVVPPINSQVTSIIMKKMPDANVKPVLNSNQIGPTETPVKIPQIPSDSKSKSEDETCRQKRNKQAKITTVVLALLTFLPIATLIVGQIHKNDCPIQTWIPQWMTIFGAVGLATFGVLIFIGLITILCCFDDDECGYGIGGCVLCLLIFFFLAWLIAGSVWVFSINRRVQFNETIWENYCTESLYKFTFGTLLAQYALIGLFVCCGGCVGLIVLCEG